MITLVPPPSVLPDSEKKPAYNLVIIYENVVTGKRANRFCEKLMLELGETKLGIKDLWSFKVLDIPHVRRAAAEAATAADLVILALDGPAELADGIKSWMEQWVGQVAARVEGQCPILVALFNASDGEQGTAALTRTFLGALAETAGMTFLHTMGKTTTEDQLPV